jgi:hypothetical protein
MISLRRYGEEVHEHVEDSVIGSFPLVEMQVVFNPEKQCDAFVAVGVNRDHPPDKGVSNNVANVSEDLLHVCAPSCSSNFFIHIFTKQTIHHFTSEIQPSQ